VLAWVALGYLSAALLFMYSGAMAHGAKVAHPVMGNAGCIIAGLSPIIAYVSYRGLGRWFGSSLPRGLLLAFALAIFVLCQWLGITLLDHAIVNGITHLG